MDSPDIAAYAATLERLEQACVEWADVSQVNYQRAKAAEARIAELEAENVALRKDR
jgi:hypothetical protein